MDSRTTTELHSHYCLWNGTLGDDPVPAWSHLALHDMSSTIFDFPE